MPLFITILAITIAQLPGLVMRYLPFSKSLELGRKKSFFYITLLHLSKEIYTSIFLFMECKVAILYFYIP